MAKYAPAWDAMAPCLLDCEACREEDVFPGHAFQENAKSYGKIVAADVAAAPPGRVYFFGDSQVQLGKDLYCQSLGVASCANAGVGGDTWRTAPLQSPYRGARRGAQTPGRASTTAPRPRACSRRRPHSRTSSARLFAYWVPTKPAKSKGPILRALASFASQQEG